MSNDTNFVDEVVDVVCESAKIAAKTILITLITAGIERGVNALTSNDD